MTSSRMTCASFHRSPLLRAGASLVLAVTLAGGTAFLPATVVAAPSSELSSELESARAKLVDLTEQLELAEATVEDTEIRLGDTRTQIDDLEGKIKKNEEALSSAQAELSQYVVSSYKGGNVTIFDLLFSSSSFDELASRMFYANKVATAQSDSIERVQTLQTDLDNQRSELSQQEDQLKTLLTQQQESADELSSSRDETNAYIDGLSDELREALAAERAEAAKKAQEAAATSGSTSTSTTSKDTDSSSSQTSQDDDDDSKDSGSSTSTGGGSQSKPSGGNQGSTKPSGGSDSSNTSGGGTSGGGSSSGSSNMSSSQRSAVVSAARSQVGVAYDYGAQSPGVAFDCSGLTQYSYRCAGISIPRGGTGQYNAVKAADNLTTNESALQAGDLVFYQTNGRIRHVGIYIGGGQVCHASDYSTGVIITNLHYSRGFCGGGSPL